MTLNAVWLSDEAYQTLAAEKQADETPSDVIVRLTEQDDEDSGRERIRA